MLSVDEGVEKLEPSCSAGGNVNFAATLDYSLAVTQMLKQGYHMTQQFYL